MSEIKATCATCKHMGNGYHGLDPYRDHHCGKTQERRAETMKTTGDFADDFMRNWRTFFDARFDQRICRHYEDRPIASEVQVNALKLLAVTPYQTEITLAWDSPEQKALSGMRNGPFVEQGWGGYNVWKITKVGRMEIDRALAARSVQS